MNERPIANLRNKAQPTTRRGLVGLLAAIAATIGWQSTEYKKAKIRGYRSGKHNGRTVGAFGRVATKSHRALYVGATR